MQTLGQLLFLLLAACGIVGLFLILMVIAIAIPTFVGWFMGLAAAWMFGPWLEQGVQQLLHVDMSLDLLGAVLGFLFGIARLGISAAQSNVMMQKDKDA